MRRYKNMPTTKIEFSETKKIIRGYFIDFLKQTKPISIPEFELISQFENYIVKRMEKDA